MSSYTRFAVVPTMNTFIPFQLYVKMDMPGVNDNTQIILITIREEHATTTHAQEEEIIKLEGALRTNTPPLGYRFNYITFGLMSEFISIYPPFKKALVGLDYSTDREEHLF